MTATKIIWETPPEATGFTPSDPNQYAEIVKALRSKPGSWAVVDTFEGDKAASQAYRVAKAARDGKRGFTGPGVTFEARTHKDGKIVKVYVRAVATDLKVVPPDAAEAADNSVLDGVTAAAPQAGEPAAK
jgi:hypothetical protein